MTTVQMTNAQGWHQHLALSIIVHHLDGYFGILTVSLFNMKNMVAIPFEDGVFVLIELQSFTILTAEWWYVRMRKRSFSLTKMTFSSLSVRTLPVPEII